MASTIKDIRTETGLGLATISKYLNGGNVRPENKEKIEAAIKKLHYRPNETARSLVKGKSRTVGFVVNNIASSFSGVIIQETSDYLRSRGYGVLICDSGLNEKQEAENIRFCLDKQVDGIIVISVSHDAGFLKPAKKAGIPVVLLDREIASSGCDTVTINNADAASLATDLLIENGHKHIAMIHSEEYTGALRYAGFCRSMESHNIKVQKKYVYSGKMHSTELGYQSMKKILSMKDRPTAVLNSNYEVSLGVIMAINESGLRLPEDISVIGFDELILPMVMKSKLTVVAQPMEDIAKEGAKLLLSRIEDEVSVPPRKVCLHAILKSGDSVYPLC